MSADAGPWTPRLADPGQAEQAEVRVRFGQLPSQTLPLDWAEQFITIVYAEQPHVFRAILPRLYGLPEPPKRTRRPE